MMLAKRMGAVLGLCLVLGVSVIPAQGQEDQQDRPRRGRGDFGGRFGGGPGGPGGRGGDLFGLLSAPEVKEALKVTDEEQAYLGILADDVRDKEREFFESIRDLSEEQRREKFRARMETAEARAAETQKQIQEILGEERTKRLKQIRLQVGGVMALFSPEVSKEVGITDQQRDKVREMFEGARDEMRELFTSSGDDPEARRKAFDEFRKKQETKVLGILTDEQKAKWESLKGEPINFKLDPPGFGPRGRRGDGDGDRGPRDGGRRRSRPNGDAEKKDAKESTR
ncbi:MAG: hypothetical protein U1D30_12950 [Planctomycetota bacterium]